MKHFIVDINYTKPIEAIEAVLPRHREFLQTGYEAGLLLCSGPKSPRTGGIIVCRAESREKIVNFFLNDPYHLENVATHTVTEFEPVKHQAFLSDWV